MANDKKIIVLSSKSLVMATDSNVLIHYESADDSVTDEFMYHYSTNRSNLDQYKLAVLEKRKKAAKEKSS